MPSGIYYNLADTNGNGLIFVATTQTQITNTRTIWDNPIPYVHDVWLSDQVSTEKAVTIQGAVKAGPGFPYATLVAAVAAIESLTPQNYSNSFSLNEGDWNGSAWVNNNSYPIHVPSVIVSVVQYVYPAGEPFDVGEIVVTITISGGMVL